MTAPDTAPNEPTPPPTWNPLLIVRDAVAIALIGCVFIALIETGGVTFKTADRFPQGLPWDLIVSAFGKVVLTHLLLWTPLVLVLGLLLCRGNWADGLNRVALLTGLFFSLSMPVVLVGDLMVLNFESPVMLAFAAIAGLGSGYLACRMMLWSSRTFAPRLTWTSFAIKTVVAGLLFAVGLSHFVASPYLGENDYRIGGPVPDAQDGQRNVLWIVLDTVRADRLGVYGFPANNTPRLAARSDRMQRFERTVTPGIWTVPGHATMFTGMSTREHGADDPDRWLDADKQTIAEKLGEMGYATAGFSNNPWISPHTNLSQGLSYYAGMNHYRHLGRFSLEYLLDRFGLVPPLAWLDGDYGAAATNYCVRQWLEQRDTDKPFFVFVNYLEAHAPYRIPHGYRERYIKPENIARSYALRKSLFGEIADVVQFEFNIEGADFLTPTDREILRGQYDAAIEYLDMRVEELLTLLDQSGLADDTLVVITADHGEYLDEHGMWGHTFLCYDGLTRVPLLLQVPGRDGAVHDEIAHLADLWPTVMNWVADSPQPHPGYGTRDLLAPVTDEDKTRLAVTLWSGASTLKPRIEAVKDNPEVTHRGIRQRSIQDGRYKLLVSDDGRRELYDLPADPGERTNLHDRMPEVADRLWQAMQAWEDAVPLFVGRRPGKGTEDEDVMRDLAALGYVGGTDEDDAESDDSDE